MVNRYTQRKKISVPSLFLFFSLALLAVSLTGPSFGQISKKVSYNSLDVAIVLDISGSMLAEDTAPSRLGRAKEICLALTSGLKARYSLTVFKGDAITIVPLTEDDFSLLNGLRISSPAILTAPGTNISLALEKASSGQVSKDGAKKIILLLSDGEIPEEENREIPTLSLPVYTVGLGTDAGSVIRWGENSFITDTNGAVVVSRRNAEFLDEIAVKSGGEYIDGNDATAAAMILKLFEQFTESRFPGNSYEGIRKDSYRLFVLGSLLFLSLHIIFKAVKWRE